MREEYKYNTMFSEGTNKNLEMFHNITEDCKEILLGLKYLDVFTGEKTEIPSDDVMLKFNDYLLKYVNEENSGILRTLLIVSKPYKNHIIINNTFEILANKLRTISGNNII